MRRFTQPARRRLTLPLLLAGIAFTASCGTSPERPPQRVGADGETRGDVLTGPVSVDERTYRDSPYIDLFASAEDALDSGDWMAAELALPRSAEIADAEFSAYEAYMRARMAWQRGQLDSMVAALDGLPTPALSDTLTLKILQLRRERAHLERRHLQTAQLSIRMLDHLPPEHRDFPANARQAWRALQRVPEASLNRAATEADTAGEAGWMTAAYLSRYAQSTEGWRARYPGHPAEPFLASDIELPTPRRVALLLPLSGRIADAAAAVRDGFIARYFAQRAAGTIDWDLIVLDTADHASTRDAYNAAIDSGAQLVVGPLTKVAVGDLLANPGLPVPVIALNRSGGDTAAGENSLQFALAPEDEAAQLARLAFADGHRRALLVRPAGEWGSKMTQPLHDTWLDLGGRIAATATYSSRDNHSDSLAAALDLDASRQRAASLRQRLSQPIEISGRRRADIDSIFLLAPGAGDARSLKPLLAYHYAGDLPAYATSSANSDEGRGEENDLNGLRLVEMPRILQGTGASLRGEGYGRLGALGADACRLAGLGMQPFAIEGPILQGDTGFLSVNGKGQVERDLEPAIFDRGVLRRR